jgi:formylmethanofuran dehydrogenase subunit E
MREVRNQRSEVRSQKQRADLFARATVQTLLKSAVEGKFLHMEADEKTPSQSQAEEIIHCPICGQEVPPERVELLGVTTCIKCTPQRPPPIGAWDYPEGFHERNEGVGGLIVLDQ